MTLMSVPEAAMHEDNGSEARKHKIGTSRQVFPVKPETQSERMKATTQHQFGLCVTGSDAAHIEPPLVGCQDVDHGASGSIAGVCSPDDRCHFLHSKGGQIGKINGVLYRHDP